MRVIVDVVVVFVLLPLKSAATVTSFNVLEDDPSLGESIKVDP